MRRATVAAVFVVALAVLGLGCKAAPSSKPLAGTPAVTKPPVVPSLQGRYRVDATLALDASSAAKLGSERVHTLDALRAADQASLLVSGELSWTLGPAWLVVRQESLKRMSDGSYQHSACEAEGAITWLENDAFVVSREIRARASSGSYTRTSRLAQACSVSVPSGTYRISRDASELVARRADPEASWGYLLVSAAGHDLDTEAKRLSGYSE